MKLHDILEILNDMAPLAIAEDFDNVGLLVGNLKNDISGILVCHDALENVINEAIENNCNLVVCFHPIIFSGLKRLTGNSYVERSVVKAIRNDIAIYAVHTALDNHKDGVNKIFSNELGLTNTQILIPKTGLIRKLVTYIPSEHASVLRTALFNAGAGNIGNYDMCSFNSIGSGTYRGNENSSPVIGTKGVITETVETKIEVTFEKHRQSAILKAMFDHHIYEEVAYEIYELENQHQQVGLGMIGTLPSPMAESDFLQFIAQKTGAEGIRHSKFLGKVISRVAVLGGSGSFAISNAIAAKADAFITADLKYHQYYEAEDSILLADIGHYESERYTKNYIVDFLRKKIPNFAIILSKQNTNPVKYF